MYRDAEQAFGQGGAIALPLPGDVAAGAYGRPGFADRARDAIAGLDLVVDLGAEIGSRRWWRGLATCIALCTVTWNLAPARRPLVEAVPAPYTPAQWKEARVLGTTPLAYGADTGSRLAPTRAAEPLAGTPDRPQIELSATLGQGDGFARVLERAGVTKADARAVRDAVARAVPLRSIRSGARMDLRLGRRDADAEARPLEAVSLRARIDLRLELRRDGKRFRVERVPVAVDDTPLRLGGRIGDDLAEAVRNAGAPEAVADAMVDALGKRVALNRLRGDDRFDLVVEHRRAADGETDYGDLLYAGVTSGRSRAALMRWERGGRSEWLDASGTGPRHGLMIMPVVGHLTSSFGMRRHPILGFSRLHKGQDYGAPYGSPILAAIDGTVSFAGRHGGHGNYVMLHHDGGIDTAYAHMSRIVAHRGERVVQGQLIGYVGSTGLSTGPHLHYEVYRNGVAVNPRTFSFIGATRLDGRELKRFQAKWAALTGSAPVAAPAPVTGRTEPTASSQPKAKRERHHGRRHHRRR